MHLIYGPKALDRGIQEACVSGVTQSPSRWLRGGICYHPFLGFPGGLWLGCLLESGFSPGFSFCAGGQNLRRDNGNTSRRMVVEVRCGFEEGVREPSR